jgi:hypothetical protein
MPEFNSRNTVRKRRRRHHGLNPGDSPAHLLELARHLLPKHRDSEQNIDRSNDPQPYCDR